jgi:DNA-binding transcriptional MocR family regulator
MGLVSGETGRGTFVRETSLSPGLGVDQTAVAAGVTDLNFNYPSLPGQAELLRNALRQLALSGDLEALLRYQPHAGRAHERAVIARHLLDRGLRVDAQRVLVVNGAQHGLAVAVMALLKPGEVIAADALTYPGFKALAESLHVEVAAIPSTPSGPDLDALDRLCRTRRVRAIYTMPTLHNPLGWVMGAPERERLVAIARKRDLHIIEDAAYAYLVEKAPPPLAEWAPERTVYVSGLSKNVAAGLRIGFVVAPTESVSAIERAIRVTTWSTPGMLSAIATAWIEDGTVARMETAKRRDARVRQTLARKRLAGIPGIGHPSSYFLWLPLPEDARADQIAKALMQQNVSVSTAEPFCTSPHVPHAIRLARGSVEMSALDEALSKVARVVGGYS